MSDAYLEAPTSEELTTEHLAAGADRRFYAFVVDRLFAWGVIGGEAYAAYTLLIEPGRLWTGVAAIAGTVLMVGLLGSMLVGLFGLTPGKALVGIRVLSSEDARPIGLLRAMLRTLLLGVATLPTLGFGAAALAWTAMVDPSGWRRGWHDLRTGSVVVDVRPVPMVEEPEEEAPRQVVNLTAMRLVPASPTPPRRIPTRGKRPPAAAPPEAAAPPAQPTVTPRQGLGWPLVGEAPADAAPDPAQAADARAAPDRAAGTSGGRPHPAAPARHRRAAGSVAGHLRHRRAVRGARPDPGRPAARAAAGRAGQAAGHPAVRRHEPVQDARAVPGGARRGARGDGPRLHQRLDPDPRRRHQAAGRRQARHDARRRTGSGSAIAR